ncbi:MAG TPA: hypothetical protein VKA45_09185 [Gaiellaceae bacterium]|nr:hypothetical protein [Gaiellaceae bacterium]
MPREIALVVLALAGCSGSDGDEQLRSKELIVDGRTNLTVDPGPPRRPLLVLLHGRGMQPKDLLWKKLRRTRAARRPRAGAARR